MRLHRLIFSNIRCKSTHYLFGTLYIFFLKGTHELPTNNSCSLEERSFNRSIPCMSNKSHAFLGHRQLQSAFPYCYGGVKDYNYVELSLFSTMGYTRRNTVPYGYLFLIFTPWNMYQSFPGEQSLGNGKNTQNREMVKFGTVAVVCTMPKCVLLETWRSNKNLRTFDINIGEFLFQY